VDASCDASLTLSWEEVKTLFNAFQLTAVDHAVNCSLYGETVVLLL
jgi:hypothetical protein